MNHRAAGALAARWQQAASRGLLDRGGHNVGQVNDGPTPTGPRIGRPRQFDEDAVLDAMEHRFHLRGYHATSMSDLLTASGLHKGSVYGAFGNKHSVFLAVLRRHADRRLALFDADTAAPATPWEGIERYLRRQAHEAVGGRGCLVANTAMELLPGDDDVEEVVTRYRQRIEARLATALERAVPPGRVADGREPRTLARLLLTLVQGLWEQGRTARQAGPLLDVVEEALTACGRPVNPLPLAPLPSVPAVPGGPADPVPTSYPMREEEPCAESFP